MRSLLLISIITTASAQAVFTDTDTLRAAVRDPSCCDNGETRINEYGVRERIRPYSYNNSCSHNGVHIEDWDVSQITDFSSVLSGDADECLKKFNADISKWVVSNGENFQYMFYKAFAFNQDISSWDVFQGMKFQYMFSDARAFNQDISSWRPNPPTDTDALAAMFVEAESFNQNLDDWGLEHHGNEIHMFTATYSLTHRPNWYTAVIEHSCIDNPGCGTCGQRLHSHFEGSDTTQYGLPTYTVTCNGGFKSGVTDISCSDELCVDDNSICCESPCGTLDASNCKSNSICWWDTDVNTCIRSCSKPIKDLTDRKCANTASSLAGISCGSGTRLIDGECKPACASDGCVELVEAYKKTQCD